MAGIPDRLLDVLAESFTLHHVEAEPATPSEISEKLAAALDLAPPTERVSTVLKALEADDRIRPDDAESGSCYLLTQDGARLLHSYRTLPAPVTGALGRLLHLGGDEAPSPSASGQEPQAPSAPPDQGISRPRAGLEDVDLEEGWVGDVLDQLPIGPDVEARYARVSLDHEPGSNRWTLTVEQHDPGAYEGASACPLTFLYAAATRLLYRPPRRSRPGDASSELASSPTPS